MSFDWFKAVERRVWMCVCVCVIILCDTIWHGVKTLHRSSLSSPCHLFLLSWFSFIFLSSIHPSLVRSSATSACLISSLFLSSLFILYICGPFLCIIHSPLRLETLITALLSHPTETRLNQTHTHMYIHKHRQAHMQVHWQVLVLFSSSYHATTADFISRQKKKP